MSFFPRRKRRPDDARYLPKDEAAWRRLVRLAAGAAAQPLGPMDHLHGASMACRRAVIPPGHAHRGSLFLRLVLETRGFATLGPTLRAEKAASLGELAAGCAAVLDAPKVRERKDVEG